MLSNSILASNIITYKKDIDYLLSNKFKDHSYGNSGGYGLNFLGAKPIIKYNNDLWIFIHWQIGVDVANFVNVKGEIFSFNPHHKHSDIIRMIEDN
jgi:hypothetical protein